MLELPAPFVIFLGDVKSPLDAKTGFGLAHWRPELCVGQHRLESCQVDLGLPDLSIEEAHRLGAKTLVIGVAPSGGQLPPSWLQVLLRAVHSGLHIASGLHQRLNALQELSDAASKQRLRLIDVREVQQAFPIANGIKRSGRRLLTVGTDCCVGKKYSALAIHRALLNEGSNATFRASGQTGIMISGAGIPIDAVVSDFLSGAAEALSPANEPQHWDIIEGQGSLFHPAYSAVTLGLLHGSQPDALILCHDYARTHIDEYEDYPIPPLAVCLEHYLQLARLSNPAVRFAGVCLNTSSLVEEQRQVALRSVSKECGLPCVDPMLDDLEPILALLREKSP